MRDYLDNRPIKLSGQSPRRPLALALLLCLLAILLLFGDQSGMLGPVRGLAEQALGPVAQHMTGLRDNVVGFWSGVNDVQQVRAENEDLKRQISQLQEDVIDFDRIQVENERLRQQLDIPGVPPPHVLGAEVIVRSPDAGRRVITIAKGSDAGIQPGMAVTGQTDTEPYGLVGIVEATTNRTASVLLITDFGSQISAHVLHDGDTALGIVQGQWQRGSRLRLEKMERELTMAVGDKVVSAGLTNELGLTLELAAVPAGIPIGSVESISSDGHVQIAELRPYVDPDQVRYVWVILNQDD